MIITDKETGDKIFMNFLRCSIVFEGVTVDAPLIAGDSFTIDLGSVDWSLVEMEIKNSCNNPVQSTHMKFEKLVDPIKEQIK